MLFLAALLPSCKGGGKQQQLPFKTKKEYEQTMIESHKLFLQKEKEKIKTYIDSSNYQFTQSGSGLYYAIYEKGGNDTLEGGENALIAYTLSIMNGDTISQTKEGKYFEFTVDFDQVESGLHEGIKLMAVGDRARFILPAHLAHGITGDQMKIPSQATLVYDVKLLAKR
mgnify:CR=1 FL=1